MVEISGVRRLYRLRRGEFALSLVCFLGVASLGVIRGIFIAVGLSLLAFIWPAFYISIIPWKLTELTARILAGWTLLSAASVLSLAVDGRWSATRLLLQSAMFAQALTLLSLPRIWPDLDPAKPMSYVFVGGLAAALVVSAVIHALIDRRSRTPVLQTLKKGIF